MNIFTMQRQFMIVKMEDRKMQKKETVTQIE